MSLVIAIWPNNTASVIRMRNGFSMLELFEEIDAEANPHDAECYLVKGDSEGLYVTFDLERQGEHAGVKGMKRRLKIGCLYGKHKRLFWPEDITEQHYESLKQMASLLNEQTATEEGVE